jgi:hypothetical protein
MFDSGLNSPINVDHLVSRLCPGAQLSEDDKRSLSSHVLRNPKPRHKIAEWTPDVPVGTYPNLNRLLQRLPDFRERYRDTRWPPEWHYFYIVDLEELSVAVGWPTGKLAELKPDVRWPGVFYRPEDKTPNHDELEQWVASRGGADCVADYVLAQLELEKLKRQAQWREAPGANTQPDDVDAVVAVAVAEAEAGRPVNGRDRLTRRQLDAFRKAAKQPNMSARDVKEILKDASGIGGPLLRISGDSKHTAGYFGRENGDELSRQLKRRSVHAD